MTLYEFNSATEDEKGTAIWDGAFLADREEGGLKIQLYSVSNFFVEVYYDGVANKIVKFRAFKSQRPLAPYLDQINIKL